MEWSKTQCLLLHTSTVPNLGSNQDGPTWTLPSACDHNEASSCWLPVSAIKNPKESFGLTSSYHHSRDPQPLSFNYPAHSLPEIQEKTRPWVPEYTSPAGIHHQRFLLNIPSEWSHAHSTKWSGPCQYVVCTQQLSSIRIAHPYWNFPIFFWKSYCIFLSKESSTVLNLPASIAMDKESTVWQFLSVWACALWHVAAYKNAPKQQRHAPVTVWAAASSKWRLASLPVRPPSTACACASY